jgi:hypothetical protein
MNVLFDLLKSADSGEILEGINEKIEDFLARAALEDFSEGHIVLAINVDIQGIVAEAEGTGVKVRLSSVELTMKKCPSEEFTPKAAVQKPN